VLEKWCNENEYEMFWFTPILNRKLYVEAKKKFSVNLEEVV
jgi:hypothetical protein